MANGDSHNSISDINGSVTATPSKNFTSFNIASSTPNGEDPSHYHVLYRPLCRPCKQFSDFLSVYLVLTLLCPWLVFVSAVLF